MFDFVVKERQAYIFARRKNEVNDAGIQRLVLAGEIARLLISTGIAEFKSKTCRHILNHITNTVLAPTLDDKLCVPLLDCYSKSFRMIVERPSHVEHLPLSDIKDYLTFLCKLVDAIIETLGSSSIDTESSIYLFASQKPSQSDQRRFSYSAAELLQSIFLLLSFSSGITTNQMDNIWNTLGRYIKSGTESAAGDLYAISIANIILNLSSSSDFEFCERVSLLTFEQLPHFWNSKSTPVREALLIFIQYSYPFMTGITTRIDEAPPNVQDQLFISLSDIETFLQNESVFASTNLNLLSSDIDINAQFLESNYGWFTQNYFYLRATGNILAWMTMLSYHKISVLKHIISFSSFTSRLKKRRAPSIRTTSNTDVVSLEHHVFREIINSIENSNDSPQHIQTLLVQMQQGELPDFLTSSAFDALSQVVKNNNAEIAAWALLAVCYLLRIFPQSAFDITHLDGLWNVTCKRFYHPSLNSVSSFFLATMLMQNRLPAAFRKLRIERLLGMFDSSGPQLSNGSIHLARQLLSTYSLSVSDESQSTPEKLMYWLTSNWKIDFSKPLLSVSPGNVSRLILSFCGIDFNLKETLCYSGPFQLAYSKSENINLGLRYLKTGKTSFAAERDDPLESQSLHSASPELTVNIISNLMETCEAICEALMDAPTAALFASSAEFYEQIINFVGSLFMATFELEKTDKASQSQCRELALKLQLILKELCSISSKSVMSEDHVCHIMLGTRYLIDIYPHITESFYLEVYKQVIEDLLTIFRQKVNVASSFSDEIKENEDPIQLPECNYLHGYHVAKSLKAMQTFTVYTRARLLHSKMLNNIDFLEAITKLFQKAESANEIAAMTAAFIDFLPPARSRDIMIASALLKLIREIGEKLLCSYEWDRAEIVILFCIKLLQDYAPIWTLDNTVHTDCLDILEWLCKLLFDGGYKNYRVQTNLTTLLTVIMKHSPSLLLNGDKSLPGCFGLLITDSPDIIYNRAQILPDVFKNYPITSHIVFFNGIQDVLGRIYHQKESLAARCYLLTYLAQSSDSLLTGSVFNLLELSEFQEAQLYIKNGILTICSLFQGVSLKDFFHRQAEELLYLWFSNGLENQFPFQYFGYNDEVEFLSDHHYTIVVLLAHLKKSNSVSLIRDIGRKINARNIDTLLISAAPKVWSYELTSGTRPSSEFWLKKELGANKWGKTIKHGMPVFLLSLILLVDLSTIPQSAIDGEGIFGRIYSQITPATLVSFPQPLIDPKDATLLVKEAVDVSGMKKTFPTVGQFSYVLRGIINNIVQSVDPIQKSINLRRLLFFASNYNHGDISGYPLKIILRAISNQITNPISRVEVFRALRELMETFSTNLTTEPETVFQISLQCLHFSFSQNHENSDCEDLTWLRDLTKNILSGPFLYTLQTMFSWLDMQKCDYRSDQFISTFKNIDGSTQKVLLNIIAIEMDSNPSLYRLLEEVTVEQKSILNKLLSIEPISTRGYTNWICRLFGKTYLSEGPNMLSSVSTPLKNQLASPGNPIELIFDQIILLLEDEDLEIVNYSEDVIRHLQAYGSHSHKSFLVDISTASLTEAMDYTYAAKEYFLQHFEFSDITDSRNNTVNWIFKLCSTLALAVSTKIPELECLALLLPKVPKFVKLILPFVIHLYLKVCVTKRTSQELDEMFNTVLRSQSNLEVNRLIIETFFHLRANNMSKDRLGKKYFDMDIKAAIQSCLTSDLPDMALMLAELEWSNSELNGSVFRSFDLTVKIYEKVSDPDMYYAIPIEPDLNGAMKTFLHEGNHSRLLQYQSALFNEDIVIGEKANNLLLPDTLQNTGMLGMSQLVLDYLLPENEAALYSHAWKLQQWDLAYSKKPTTQDEIVFNLHRSLNSTGESSDPFYQAFQNTLPLLKLAAMEQKDKFLETLAVIQESESILSVEDNVSAIKISKSQLQNGRVWMDMSR